MLRFYRILKTNNFYTTLYEHEKTSYNLIANTIQYLML